MSTDFPNGLADINEYLDTRHHVNTNVQGQVGDNAKVVVKSEYDFTLREIICNLLAGRGIKLPNIQVCLSVNLKAILGVDSIQDELRDALDELDQAFDEFMDHTELESVLGRINKALAEATQISNMINFCATPIEPIAIPNLLEQTMEGFLGAGKELIDRIGSMVPNEVGGCLGFNGQDFNLNLFNGGILGDISSQWASIKSGSLTQNQLNSLVTSINSVKDDLRSLINRENSVAGTENLGGSQFTNDVSSSVNQQMGVLHNSESAGIQGNTRIASQLKAQYDRLAGYPVIDKDGNVYNNIFELILEPGLIDLLNRLQDPSPSIGERQPVFNYCGEIVGYTQALSQTDPALSEGTVPSPTTPDGQTIDITNYPGYQAGGLDTSVSSTGGAGGSNTTIINSTTVNGGTVKIVSSLSAQLNLISSLNEGDIVVRSDQNVAYARNTNTTNTIADFTAMAVPVGNYLQNLDNTTSVGIVVKDGLLAQTRRLTTQSGQLSITNDTGQAGDIQIELAQNPVLPGTAAVQIPRGTTSQRPNTEPGEIRYNTDLDLYEGYFGGGSAGWRTFSTNIGAAAVNNASNLGGGSELFVQNNNGNLEFRTLVQAGGITVSQGATTVTISDQITASNQGTGQQVLKARNGNDFEFRTITGTNNITVTTVNDAVNIAGDENKVYSDPVQSSTGNQTEILFNGNRITPATDTSMFVSIIAIGKVQGGTGTMAIKREAVVENNAGAITIVSDASTTTVYNNNVGGAWDLIFDASNNDFRVFVQGQTGYNIDWNVSVDKLPVG